VEVGVEVEVEVEVVEVVGLEVAMARQHEGCQRLLPRLPVQPAQQVQFPLRM